jgi:hypothetical protein
VVAARVWRVRLKLNGDVKPRDVSLGVSDKQVAEQKLREVIRDHERTAVSAATGLTSMPCAPVTLRVCNGRVCRRVKRWNWPATATCA